jgi:hypothetical protein
MSEINSMKRLAIKTNDVLVAVGLIGVALMMTLVVVSSGWLIGLVYGLIGFIFWAIGSGLWCVLSGIHDELKKLNNKA